MATVPSEVTQLSKIIGGLLINFGTIKDLEGFLAAGTFFLIWNVCFCEQILTFVSFFSLATRDRGQPKWETDRV